MSGLHLYLFGAPRLEKDGENLAVGRRKGLAILAYLALRGQPQSREALATLFWPDYDQSGALSNLRRELSRLRTGLDVDLVLADRRQVELAPETDLWVDVKEYQRLLAQVAAHDNHFPAEPCPDCKAALREAVALHTERFLAGFNLPDCPEFDDWQFFEAEGLSQSLAEALQKLIQWYVQAGEHDEAIRHARRWLALDPLHEPAHRELMTIYARAGQQAAALRQYEECVRLLEEELGIEPEQETVQLYEAIRLRRFPLERPEPVAVRTQPPEKKPAEPIPPEERYLTEERLAVGGQGEVYLGRDSATGEKVIIKRLRPELAADGERVARFVREGEALRRLDHPNIVHMLDAYEAGGQYTIVMEYVPGGTLSDRLQAEAPLPVELVLSLGLELADALARAHHLGIIHRDLKPANVLLTADGSPRLTDFGAVRLVREDVRLTRTGALVGSPAYMSPEALRGDRLDQRSDIWSLGVLLYEMLAGQRPFAGDTLTQVLVLILSEPPPPLATLRPDLPLALLTLVEQMLSKEPDGRPGSMRQVAAALDAIQAGRWPRSLEPVHRPAEPAAEAPAPALRQEIRFCQAPDGAKIAYATVGSGPPLVKVANWLSHLEYEWQSPVWNHWLSGLARRHTLIRYDMRGCGLSTWELDDLSFESRLSDLEAVVEAAGLERFPLFALSGGGATAVAYAARHPEKVSHLVLYGAYARGRRHRDNKRLEEEEAEMFLSLMRLGWGRDNPAFRQVYTSLFIPEGTPEQYQWFNDLQRMTATPENAARIYDTSSRVDVRDLATKVQAPTLILHARDDQLVSFREGKELAALIPNAQFASLESKNHILLEHEPAWAQFLATVYEFLETPGEIAAPRQWPATLDAIQAGRRPRSLEPAHRPAGPAAEAPALRQEIRFCRAPDGVQIAYATVGEGPPLVKAANYLTHLEHDWNGPVWRHWLHALAAHHTLIRYDERGSGLSDWNVADFSMDAWVRDLEAVVDTLGLDRFPLLGISQGASVCVAYAVKHPERVTHLILYGGYARGRFHRDPVAEHRLQGETMVNAIRVGWGKENPAFRQLFTTMLIPGGTDEQKAWLNELARISATPENAATMEQAFYHIEVSELARQVTAPALVLHSRNDASIPFVEGRLLASLIPGARFVPLESDNHILLEHEPAWAQFLAAVYDFLETPGASAPRQRPAASPAQKRPEPPAADVEQPLFVAREAELGWLEERLDSVLAGDGQVALVTGEAGQGKSSLMDAFMRRASQRHLELVAVTGHGNAYTGQGDPYLPFREILQALSGSGAADSVPDGAGRALPAVLEALVEVGPDLLDIFIPSAGLLQRARGVAPDATVAALESLVVARAVAPEGAHLQQGALFAQVAALLEAVSRRHPLVLFLDDLQWIDQGSANLLLYLGKRLGGSRILFAGAYRPAEVSVLRDGARHPLQQVINELRRDRGDIIRDLSAAEGRAFVNALLDSQPNRLDERFRATLYRQTQGHPLFTLELLRDMQERGDLVWDEDAGWIARTTLDWEKLPARVEGVIGERISRLSPEMQELLQIASVVGEEFPAELLAQVTGREPAALARLLGQELDRTHRLLHAAGIRHDGQRRFSIYRFRHILIQRYLYQQLDEAERAYRHEAVAGALEALHGQDAARLAASALARHFAAAEQPHRAAPYWREAGDQAWRAAAIAEATQYYRSALDAWPEADEAGRAALLRQLGSCHWFSSRLDEAMSHLETAFELYTRLDDRQGAGAVQRAIGRLHWEQGDRQLALQHYRRALELLEQGPEGVELAWAYSSISQMHMLAWEHEDAVRWGERAMALARRLDAPDVLSHALNNVGSSLWQGDPDKAIAMLQESKELALKHRLPHDLCRAYYNLASGLLGLSRTEEAWVEYDGMLQAARRWSLPLFAAGALIELAHVEWRIGRWREALARSVEVAGWLEQGQSVGYLEVLAATHEARVANALGRHEEALNLLEEIGAQVVSADEGQELMPYLREKLHALVALGRTDEAWHQVQEMLALVNKGLARHTESTMPLFEACIYSTIQGQREVARQLLAQIDEIAEGFSSPAARIARQEAEGAIDLYQGVLEEAVEALRGAAAGWQRLGRPPDEARARLALARALLAGGRREQAVAALERASVLLDGLSAQLEDETLRRAFGRGPLAGELQRIQTLLEMSASSLPSQTTPFIGREREVSELRQMLWQQPPVRLVTLVGPGGIGKTRLATEVAAASAFRFRDDLLFVPLASLTAVEQIVPAIIQALRVQFREAGDEWEQLLRYLGKRHQLLVLDNFEHLLDAASLVEELLARAPDVTILVTSREPLNLSSETVYRLSGLPYPEEPFDEKVQPSDYGAVALLLQQIARHRPGFDPEPAELQQIMRICRLVQGMPLALVLAANWIELLSLEEIADEIAGCLDLLEGELRDLPPRQRSIRAVFHSSWRMLDEETQTAMARLSVFRGHFSRQAAQAVGRCSPRVLLALVNKSWLQRGDNDFQIHELVRQFAAEQLRELPGGEEDARDAHAAYYAAFLHEQNDLKAGPRQNQAFQAVGHVFEQAGAAWRWLVRRPGGLNVIVEQMLPALYRYVESLQRGGDLVKLLELALAEPPDDLALRAVLLAAKTAFYRTGLPIRFEAFGVVLPIDDQFPEAWELAEQQTLPAFWRIVLWYGYGRNFARDEAIARMRPLLETLRAEGVQWELAFGLHHLVQLIQLRPEDEANRTEVPLYLAEALEILQQLGDDRERGYVLRSLGQMHRLRDEMPEAIRYWQEAMVCLDEAGEWITATMLHWHIGDAYLQLGDLDSAFAHYRTMSEQALSRDPLAFVGDMVGKESYEAARYGRYDRALETKWAALSYARAAGDVFTEAWATWEMGELCRLRGELDEALTWYERSLPLFTSFGDHTGYAFYHRGLADVAAARGFYAVAVVSFEESLRHAREHNHSWAQAYALMGLGRTNLALGDLPLAQEQVARAVAIALAAGDRAITLATLGAAAELFARSDRPGRALELAAFVADHPIAWTEVRARAAELQTTLTGTGAKAGVGRHARADDVWALADEVSRELATNTGERRASSRALDGPARPPV